MASEFVVPDGLKQDYESLGLAEQDIANAVTAWEGLEAELHEAAGNDEEISASIKQQAKDLNPTVRDLLTGLEQLFGQTGDKGKAAANAFEQTEQDNVNQANRW